MSLIAHNAKKGDKMAKTFWRCNVCGDVHYGVNAPNPCPTCTSKNSYVKIDAQEAKKILKL